MPDVTHPASSLSLVVVSADGSDLSDSTEIREAGPVAAIRNFFVGHKEVPLEKINAELERVQAELDDVLGKIETGSRHGFALSDVEISLGISAEGSIGVVTAGLNASITLHFTKAVVTDEEEDVQDPVVNGTDD